MVVDLHAHYPMHLIPPSGTSLRRLLWSQRERRDWRDRMRGLLREAGNRLWNYPSPSGGPAVTVPLMRAGQVGAALSVLYVPLDEMDLGKGYGAPPDPDYFPRLVRQLELVEEHVAAGHEGVATVARDPGELDAALEAGRLALVHSVEGGFHLGATPDEVERNVVELARRGVAYIGLAHLFWRGIATNVASLPFLPDRVYHRLFPQPARGLTVLGETAVRTMVREGILVDVTHMSARSFDDTLALLDELDPERGVPVIASHMACRFGSLEYNLTDDQVRRLAERDGAMGVILCDHFAKDGLRSRRTRTFDESVDVLCRHVDRIHQLTGSHRHAAIGTDLDGYIKPTLAGLQDMSALSPLRDRLRARYGDADTDSICSANALRVLRAGWGRRTATGRAGESAQRPPA
jgi:microsomal dipeptidase-like Zn-dependent dipeptidase